VNKFVFVCAHESRPPSNMIQIGSKYETYHLKGLGETERRVEGRLELRGLKEAGVRSSRKSSFVHVPPQKLKQPFKKSDSYCGESNGSFVDSICTAPPC